MMPKAFVLAGVVRLAQVLLLPQTFFQPDEFYQALEPAHHLVYGYGHLTWEWRDLPGIADGSGWWDEVVVKGRMRSWLWPGVFAAVYKICDLAGVGSLQVCPDLAYGVVSVHMET